MGQGQDILGHPKGLFVLFFTEMWERFSYYGMRALLVLYMTKHLFLQIESGQEVLGFATLKTILESLYGPMSTQALSSQLYGLYTGFVYLTPFFGGIIADQYLGQRRSVYWGGFLMAIGHLLMASERFFLPALLFLILGNGFFKPNISTQVGTLYQPGDHRRDRAYTIFYMGVNLGAFFSPLVCGTLGQKVGWHWGFGAAGIGMIIGLGVYHWGRHHLPAEARFQPVSATKKAPEKVKLTREDYRRVFALAFVCMVTVLFWGVYEQQGNTLQLWADENTDWHVFGWEMPSSWFQSFNPLLIFILAPVLDRYWGWLSKRDREAGSVTKMAIGCLWAALAYIFMVGVLSIIGDGKAHWLLLMICVLFFTIGELYLSPIGLSFVSKISPPQIISMMMGVWLMSSFFGNYLSGYVGMYYQQLGDEKFFWLLAGLAGLAGLILFVAVFPLKKLIGPE
ncbi:MAG: peptide MFS transporter [Bdellovibrionales bacterium]